MKKILSIIILASILIVGFIYSTAEPIDEHPFSRLVGDFAVMAHQGGNLERPDESLFALEYAAALPSEVLEFDIHLSKDGHLVLMHDSRVDRTTDGEGAIADLSLAELKQLNVAHWWPHHRPADIDSRSSRQEDEFPFRKNQITIATLKEVFERFPVIPMLIEIKSTEPEAIEKFGAMLERYKRWDKVIVASFHVEVLEQFRERYPQVATAATAREVTTFVLLSKIGLEALYSPKAVAMQVPMRGGGMEIVTEDFIDAAHRRGMQVHAWTLNTTDEMQTAIDLGVDGIITDRPQLLRSLITDQ